MQKISEWSGVIAAICWRNWITLLGASVTTASAMLIVGFMVLGTFGLQHSPYVGILAFMILPGVFVAGLLLIPIGVYWERRKRLRGIPEDEQPFPVLDLNKSRTRKTLGLVGFLTVINLFIISSVSYQGVVYMDSPEFCGKVCHSVMQPEYTAYINSPHARVDCVSCHIGPGAPWWVKSKLSGVGQVFAVLFETYPRPIPVPVENLRPSQDTCEQCHWPEKFTGDRMRVYTRFSEDEENTPLKTVLLMHIGGANSEGQGIHNWHIDPDKETYYYASDEKREDIDLVRVVRKDGDVTNYVASDAEDLDPESINIEQMRLMDCIDCHNRPTHIYYMPDKAMDEVMAGGGIDPTLPYIKKVGVEALEDAAEAETREAGRQQIAGQIESYYQEEYPGTLEDNREGVQKAVSALQTIYNQNVFPGMNVTWGTYPNHIGHVDFDGCFRCHDDSHTSPGGEVISQDCTACHSMLAWEEEDPAVLEQLDIR